MCLLNVKRFLNKFEILGSIEFMRMIIMIMIMSVMRKMSVMILVMMIVCENYMDC